MLRMEVKRLRGQKARSSEILRVLRAICGDKNLKSGQGRTDV